MRVHLQLVLPLNHLLSQIKVTRPGVIHPALDVINSQPTKTLPQPLEVDQQRVEDTVIKEEDLSAHLLPACD